MERLEHIVDMQQTPRGLGLRIRYQLNHRLIPPQTDKDVYRGEVTIVTKSAFNHKNPSPKERQRKGKTKAKPERDELDFPADDPTGSFDDVPDLTTIPPQTTAEIPIGPQEVEETSIFKLEYRDNQWLLVDEPEGNVQKTWFDYALQRSGSETEAD